MSDHLEKNTPVPEDWEPPILEALEELRRQRALRRTCRDQLGGLSSARLTEILAGRRKLSVYYLKMLVRGGVVSIKSILQGKNVEDLEPEKRRLVYSCMMDDEFLDLWGEAQTRGINLKPLIRQVLGKEEKGEKAET